MLQLGNLVYYIDSSKIHVKDRTFSEKIERMDSLDFFQLKTIVRIRSAQNLVRKSYRLVPKMSNFKYGMYVQWNIRIDISNNSHPCRLLVKSDFDRSHVVITAEHPVHCLSTISPSKNHRNGKLRSLFPTNLCYSSRESYNAVTNWLTDVRTLASPNIVIILCGNKKDLEDQRQVSFLEASRFADEHGRIFEMRKTDPIRFHCRFIISRNVGIY